MFLVQIRVWDALEFKSVAVCALLIFAGLVVCVQAAFIAAQSPSDDKWLMACDGGDAKCVCPDHPGLHADPLANCTQFYECNNDGSGFYKSCPPPLLFNDDSGLCDWPDNVICESESERGERKKKKLQFLTL